MKIIYEQDYKTAKIEGLDSNLIPLFSKLLSFKKEGVEYTPAYKNFLQLIEDRQMDPNAKSRGFAWDGITRLLTKKLKFPCGLVPFVENYAKNTLNLEVEIIDLRKSYGKIFDLDIYNRLEEIGKIPRDYQIDAANAILNNRRGVIKVGTGGGKCIKIDSLNITEDGILDYSEIAGSFNLGFGESKPLIKTLATSNEYNNREQSSMIYRDGISESIKIKTAYGYHETATPAHRIKVIDISGNVQWKYFRDLQIGDYAAICYDTQLFGKNDMDLDEAYWLGLLVGDGGMSAKNGTITFTNMDEHILNFINNYASKKDLKLNTKKQVSRAQEIYICSKSYRKYIYDLGFDYSKSTHKTIPRSIRMLKKEPLAMFIRGLYETDGWVEKSKASICIGLSNEKLIDQLQIILLNFGIVSSKRTKKTTHNDSFILTIYREYIKKFACEIGFDPSGRKYKILSDHLCDCSVVNPNNGIPNVNIIIKDIIYRSCKSIKKTKFFKDSPIDWQTIRSWIRPNQCRKPSNNNFIIFLNYIIKKTNDIDVKKICEILLININGVFFNRITEITKEMSDNYDFVVPNTHSFIAQGFINHNTNIAAMAVAAIGKRANIYVIGIDLLDSFHKIFSEILPFKIGRIGDGICDVQDVNIVSIWTAGISLGLKSKDILDEDNSNDEKYIPSQKELILKALQNAHVHILDECHIASCETVNKICNAITPEHIYGLSGTPFRGDNADLLIKGVLGEVLIDIKASVLIKRGILAKPIIKFINVPKMKNIGNTYQEVYRNYIIDNDIRNNIIVDNAKTILNKGYVVLVLFNNIKHGNILADKFEKAGIDFGLLSGKDDIDKRNDILNKVANGTLNCIICSKIFDIGIDAPRLSGLILAGAGKSYVRCMQRLGRCIRGYPNKKFAAVIEFNDNAKYLKKHSEVRKSYYETEEEFKIISNF